MIDEDSGELGFAEFVKLCLTSLTSLFKSKQFYTGYNLCQSLIYR